VRQSHRSIAWKSSVGAGSILALAILVSSVGTLVAGTFVSNQLVEKARLENKSDTIALATADSLRGLSKGYPCMVAKDLALKMDVFLERCRIVGFEAFVEVSSNQLGMFQEARSRAGPSN
jgi:secretion/DNA translocation related TadE-like protein